MRVVNARMKGLLRPIPVRYRSCRRTALLLVALVTASFATACGSSGVATKSSSTAGAGPGIGAAAVGTWLCSTGASDGAVTAKINSDGSFVVNPQSSPAMSGKWTVDQQGIHIQVDSTGLGLRLDVLNPALATASWPTVRQATMDVQISGIQQSAGGTLSIHLNGLSEVTFQSSPIRPGGQSSPWTCHRQ